MTYINVTYPYLTNFFHESVPSKHRKNADREQIKRPTYQVCAIPGVHCILLVLFWENKQMNIDSNLIIVDRIILKGDDERPLN
jgi:hypothetical protein